MQAIPTTSFVAASRHASALSSVAETMSGPQHRTSSSVSTRAFPSSSTPNDRAVRVGSERPATPLLRSGGTVASVNTFTYAPTPTFGATSVSSIQKLPLETNSNSTTRSKYFGLLDVLSAFGSSAPPTSQKFKKAARRHAPATALGKVVQIVFLLALMLFLHALSGTGAGIDTHLDPNPLDPNINLESKSTGGMGARSRAAYAAYAEFRKAQAAAAHLHVDPEGHFTYSFSSADAHSLSNIDTNAYWGNANAGEEKEGVPKPTMDSPSGNSATVASSPLLALNSDEVERKRSKIGSNDADDLEHLSLPVGLESMPEPKHSDLANAPPTYPSSSPVSPGQIITTPGGHRDIFRMGRHRQQQQEHMQI